MTPNDKEDRWAQRVAIVIWIVILLVVVGLSILARLYLPCWVFPLREAPVRCFRG